MNKYNKYLLSLSFLIVSVRAFAGIGCLVICDINNQETIIPINDASEITFESNLMKVGTEIYNMSLLKKYYFADGENLGVQEIIGSIAGLKIDPTGLIICNDAAAMERVEVYNLAGISQSFTIEGNIIDIRNLQPDLYIVKIGSSSIKFVKR